MYLKIEECSSQRFPHPHARTRLVKLKAIIKKTVHFTISNTWKSYQESSFQEASGWNSIQQVLIVLSVQSRLLATRVDETREESRLCPGFLQTNGTMTYAW